jgi:hypothetical protein
MGVSQAPLMRTIPPSLVPPTPEGIPPADPVLSGADKSSANTTWNQALALGVNGPIPAIVVDQFGYPTKASKIAVIRDPKVGYDNAAHFTPGAIYAVFDQSTGTIAKQGPPTPWNGGATDSVSGNKVWWFDFSDVTTPGTYSVVDVDKGLRSPEFQIDDRVYRNVLKHAVRMYFYQPAGFKKTAETAGSDWADAASHKGPGQDPQTRPWQARRTSTMFHNCGLLTSRAGKGLAAPCLRRDDQGENLVSRRRNDCRCFPIQIVALQPCRGHRPDIWWGGVPIQIIQWISVAPPSLEPRDTDAISRAPFHYAATVTRRRSGSRH